jgi:soluble lytic murein transglycosylase-like protein
MRESIMYSGVACALTRGLLAIFFAVLFPAAVAAQQTGPLSPPERSPVPMTDADQEQARVTAASKQTSLVPAPVKPAVNLIKIPGRHLSTGNREIDGLVSQAAERYRLDPCLIVSVMLAESGFNRRAVSPRGASGLMQLMPATAVRFGARDIFDPEQNVMAGASYLRWLLDRFGGDVRLALAGYNAGEGAVELYGNRIPPFLETQNYVRSIYSSYSRVHGSADLQPGEVYRGGVAKIGIPGAQGVGQSAAVLGSMDNPTYNQIIRFTSNGSGSDGPTAQKGPDSSPKP